MDASGVVIGIVGLIWDCYNRCKNNKASFHDLERDYRSLKALLQEAESDLPYGYKFDPIRAGCKQIAVDIEKMLDKYATLGSAARSRRPWELLQWSLEDIEQLRSRLIAQVVMLNASSAFSRPRGVRFDIQTHTISTRSSQSSMTAVKDSDQIWYEIYQALQASDAPESSLETLRTLVLERSTGYVPCVDSTPIVVPTHDIESVLLRIESLSELSSSETRLSTLSSNSSGSSGRKSRTSISTALSSKKSRFIKAAKDVDTETLLDLQSRVDKETVQKALSEIVRSETIIPGQPDVVRLLLNVGAHVEYPDSFYRRTPLIAAIAARRFDFIAPLLDGGAGLEARDGRRYNTPLIWAVYTGNGVILRELIHMGAAISVKDSATGYTPLILAAHLGHLDVARVLLEENGRFIRERDDSGLTPLATAYTRRDVALATLFLRFEDDKEFQWPSGLSLLAMAIVENQTDFVHLFIDNGVKITQINGFPALTAAVKQQAPPIVKLLLEKILDDHRTALEARDPIGGTALLWAVWLKNEEIVKMLLAAGADRSVKDGDGVSVQYWAQWTKNRRLVSLFAQNQETDNALQAELPG